MKIAAKLTAFSLAIVVTILIAGCFTNRDMPIKWYDEQGRDIVTAIENEFTIPNDPMSGREGIYHSGWAYRRGGVWNTGSKITIYGVKNHGTQNRVIEQTKEMVTQRQYWDVLITFLDDARYEQDGNVTTRIDVSELRSERIVGKTTSWRRSTQTQ